MLTLAEAISIAEKRNEGPVDYCHEYPDAFCLTDTIAPSTLGGLQSGCYVVMKDGSRVLDFTNYIYLHNFKVGEPLREFALKPEDRV